MKLSKPLKKMSFQAKVMILCLLGAIPLGMFAVNLYKLTHRPVANITIEGKDHSDQERNKKEENERGLRDYFVSEFYSKYASFSGEVSKDQVRRAFPIGINSEDKDKQRGWIVEVEDVKKIGGVDEQFLPRELNDYLLTYSVEKQLESPKTCSQNYSVGPDAELDKVEMVGVSSFYMNPKLKEKEGYVILSTKTSSPGTGIVAVYRIGTGEKIILQDCDSGNARGELRGISGTNEPTIITELGWPPTFSSFDVQTGRLQQHIEFK